MSTDFTRNSPMPLYTKFSNAELTKVRQVLLKSQGAFLLERALIKHHKDTFASNYMDPVKCGNTDKDKEIVSSSQSYMMPP